MAAPTPGPSKNRWRKVRNGFLKNWIDFAEILWRSVIGPLSQPAFIFYFLGIIMFVGGLGVLISLYDPLLSGTLAASRSVPQSLSTYLLAILATAFADLNLTVEDKPNRALKMFALFALVLGAAGGIAGLLIATVKLAYAFAIAGTFLALFLWWIANAKNDKLMEPTLSATAPLGDDSGDISGSLRGITN